MIESSPGFIQNLEIPCNECQRQADNLCLSVSLILQISWRRSIYLEDFFTLCVVPMAGHSYWSAKRKYAGATDLHFL